MNAQISSLSQKELAHYETLLKELKLKDLSGRMFTKEELTKGVVVLNFWASWCTPCLKEFPGLVSLVSEQKDKLLVLGINTDEEEQLQKIKKIKKEYSLNFPIIADNSGEILNKFLISAIPISIVYKDGKVLDIFKGVNDFASEEFKEVLSLK